MVLPVPRGQTLEECIAEDGAFPRRSARNAVLDAIRQDNMRGGGTSWWCRCVVPVPVPVPVPVWVAALVLLLLALLWQRVLGVICRQCSTSKTGRYVCVPCVPCVPPCVGVGAGTSVSRGNTQHAATRQWVGQATP